nr:SDR family NAD(P)-dependent oxidoreductase [Amycolatopsis sp. DSM 110486]
MTGTSSGIGLELTKQFAHHDFDVMLAADDNELTEAAEQVRSCGATFGQVRTDLTRREGVEELVEHVAATAARSRRLPSTKASGSTASSSATRASTTS